MILKEFISNKLRIILESKATQNLAFNILSKNGVENPESVIRLFMGNDTSKNQKNLPFMAYAYLLNNNPDEVITLFDTYNELENKNRISPLQIQNNQIILNGTTFNSFDNLKRSIIGQSHQYSSNNGFKPVKKPFWTGDNIDIYKADNFEDCISYTTGELTGNAYKFCIGRPNNPSYLSYRNRGNSTFYFIVDRNKFTEDNDGNPDLSDPLHMVVLDSSDNGLKFTDTKNDTGRVGGTSDYTEYIKYLKSKGVPLEKFVNSPKTNDEINTNKIINLRNTDLNWFQELPFNMKFKYISRGHILTDEQFNYITSKDLLYAYVTTGVQLPQYQVNKLSTNLKKSYIKKRILNANANGEPLSDYEKDI